MSSLRSAWRAWEAWWFPAVPLERLAAFRMAIGAFVAIELAVTARFLPAYGDVDPLFAEWVLLLRPLGGATPSSTWLTVLQVVTVLSALALAVGWRTRAAAVVTTLGYTYLWCLFNSFHKVNHGKIPIIIALAVLVIAPAGAAWSRDARMRAARRGGPPTIDPALTAMASRVAGWALRVVTVALVLAYTSSVYGKLAARGLGWVTAPILQTALMTRGSALAEWLQAQPTLLVVLQGGLLLLECSAPLLLISRRLRLPLVLSFVAFHLISLVLLQVEFLGFIVCFLAFFRLERLPEHVRALAGAPSLARDARPADRAAPGVSRTRFRVHRTRQPRVPAARITD